MSDFNGAAAKLKTWSVQMTNALPGAAKSGAKIVTAEVKRRAPRDEGHLERTIRDRPGESGKDFAEHWVVIGRFYWRFVEYGHGGPHPAPAHPFVRPAIDMTDGDAKARVQEIANRPFRSLFG